MENERLLRTAQRLENMVRLDSEEVTATNVYLNLIQRFKRIPNYMETFKPKEFVKLCILIYSIKKTGNLSMGLKIISKMKYIGFVVTNLDNAYVECDDCNSSGTEECSNCNGYGVEDCEECDGDGSVSCNICDGDGSVSCDNCDGEGEIEGETCSDCKGLGSIDCEECGGEGTENCSNCDGDGKVSCSYCSGDGDVECYTCGGSGEVESDEKVIFENLNCISWNDNLNNLCELRENSEDGVIDHTDFLEMEEILILGKSDDVGVPEFSLEADVLYCYFFENKTKLGFMNSKFYFLKENDWSYYFD